VGRRPAEPSWVWSEEEDGWTGLLRAWWNGRLVVVKELGLSRKLKSAKGPRHRGRSGKVAEMAH